MPKTKRQKVVKTKKSVFTKKKQLALVAGCQASSLTVEAYAKANKIAASTLYRWAEVAGVSLKSGKKKDQKRVADTKHPTKPEPLEAPEQKSKPDEPQQLPKLEVNYIVQEFLAILKDMATGLIRRITGKNH
ncbi:hypothetical protein [Candidatus Finniella inopinata]|uniref:Uncharacterized protein n=1 Tax=Candidatus Finniella inopinata TaxID=1696036 RepID=A0A4Q7DFB2_9PROT|nr:hypothetical protein [Candidatus Finniella inopinata]RZI45451.1 hypothetical protein EQU50_07120 [Candidatus Finniella inopinata]